MDQNQVLMEQMRLVASRHGLRLLLHEKPFAQINGSGKHLNFSLVDSEGRNLLKPSSSQRRNIQFLTLVSGLLLGISRYGSLLRASIANPGNMLRLGGNEAPPVIMSVFLGDVLTHIFDRIGEGLPENLPSKAFLNLLNRLPDILMDNTDRNRTAPIAFTGNKFEFRAPGASQPPAGPMTMILSIWAWGLGTHGPDGGIQDRRDRRSRRGPRRHQERRPKAATSGSRVTATPGSGTKRPRGGVFPSPTAPAKPSPFFDPREQGTSFRARRFLRPRDRGYYETRLEQYVKTLEIEMNVMEDMIRTGILPAVTKQIHLEPLPCLDRGPSREVKIPLGGPGRPTGGHQGRAPGGRQQDDLLRDGLVSLSPDEKARTLTERACRSSRA